MTGVQTTCPYCSAPCDTGDGGRTAAGAPRRCRQCGREFVSPRPYLDESTLGADPPGLDATNVLKPSADFAVGPLGLPRLFGRYELLEEVARGGMGVVFKARQLQLDRIVAIKMILSGQLADAEDIERFYTEARAAANLQHPNIVAIHEVGVQDGLHFFSMEFVQGKSLAQLVAQQPLPPLRAAGYLKIVAETMHFVHQQGALHRDLKPSNVLIDAFDRPRITDFGVARWRGGGQHTLPGEILGTAGFMPPEQASADYGDVGPHSDVYSLGATLYALVTGRPPFEAGTVLDTLMRVLSQPPAGPSLFNSQVSPELEAICLKCLEKDPRRRFPTAERLAQALAQYVESSLPPETIGPDIDGVAATTVLPTPISSAPATFNLRSALLPSGTINTQLGTLGVAQAGAALERLICGCGQVDGFIHVDEEQDIFRQGGGLGLATAEVEELLERICSQRGWSRHTRLKLQLLTLLQVAAREGQIEQSDYDRAIDFLVSHGMPRKTAEEFCITMMLDRGLKAKEGFLNRWFKRKQEQYGL